VQHFYAVRCFGLRASKEMPSLRFLAFAAIPLVLAACSRSDADSQEQQRRMAASWTSTAVLMLDGWLGGAVPSHYARRTGQAVSKNLSELTAGPQRQEVQRVAETLRRAERGIEASDLAAVETSRNALAAAASAFRKQARHGP
jgi:hypothetical protein